MNNKQFLKKLESMKGKTFQYANQIHYLADYKIDEQEGKCTVKTNLNTYTRNYEAMDEFLKYWAEMSTVPAVIGDTEENSQVAVIMEQENSMANEMIAILKDNINKVKASKDYIPQAQSINNNINSIINITKLKMDVYKQFKGRRG